MKAKLYLLLVAVIILPCTSNSQDLIFKFINPAFGGETFNYQWLMSSADAQNDFAEKQESMFPGLDDDPLSDFENSLNRQLLSQLSRKLIENQFGEGELEEGVYIFGNYQIEIGEFDDGLNVVIFDLSNGDQSTIFIPYYYY
ncbi:MAG TPA: curli assembly protein CsgF [Lentimicrobium sp.]|nr:curli assembly protein CsgF [Lentimicrobium sp.]